ncbi:uncharacterized protein LOC117654211 [Thrips palmi]|uniref:Uncharacterized protein LOC117654211 n=1 Tax=Thrips palmi TaxID=161013 RepID=A0A6P9ADN9_THRPL|nr:uncharacterized protein LOC117654211 [Thrips palmi]
MANFLLPLGAVALVLALFSQPGYGLTCYECNSKNDSRCALDLPPDSLKKDCSEHIEGSKYTMCRKITQSIDFEVNGLPPDSRVIRSCGWDESSYKGKCYQRSGFGGRQEVCSCLTNNCNGAASVAASAAALLGSLFVAAGYVRY